MSQLSIVTMNTAKRTVVCLLVALLGTLLVFALNPSTASAKSAAELNEEVSAAKAEYNELVRQQEEIQEQIDVYAQQITDLEGEIAVLQTKVGTFAKEMYKGGDWLSVVNALFSSESLDDLIETVDALEFYMKDGAEAAARLRSDRDRASDLRADSEAAKAELDAKVAEADAQVAEVQEAYEAALAAEQASARSAVSARMASISTEQTVDGIYSLSEFRFRGIINWGGYRFSYYQESVLPGNGLVIPGRHHEDGYVCDGDGRVCLASSDYPKGTVINIPFHNGVGCVYDSGCASGTLDVYIA